MTQFMLRSYKVNKKNIEFEIPCFLWPWEAVKVGLGVYGISTLEVDKTIF